MSLSNSAAQKRGPGRPRKHPVEREARGLPTLGGKRALTPDDLSRQYSLTQAVLRNIPRSELPRVEINQRVHLYLAEDVEQFLLSRRAA